MTTYTKRYIRPICFFDVTEGVLRNFSFIFLSCLCLLGGCSREEDKSQKPNQEESKRSKSTRSKRAVLEEDPNSPDRDATNSRDPNLSYAEIKPDEFETFSEDQSFSRVLENSVMQSLKEAKEQASHASEAKAREKALAEAAEALAQQKELAEEQEHEPRSGAANVFWSDDDLSGQPHVGEEESEDTPSEPTITSEVSSPAPWYSPSSLVFALLPHWSAFRNYWWPVQKEEPFPNSQPEEVTQNTPANQAASTSRSFSRVGVIGGSATTGFMMDLRMGMDLNPDHPIVKSFLDLLKAGFRGWREAFRSIQTQYREDNLGGAGQSLDLASWPKLVLAKLGMTNAQMVHAGGDSSSYAKQWNTLKSEPLDLILFQVDRRDFCFDKNPEISASHLKDMTKEKILEVTRSHKVRFQDQISALLVKMLKSQHAEIAKPPLIVIVPQHSFVTTEQSGPKGAAIAAQIAGYKIQCQTLRDGEGLPSVVETNYGRAMCPLTASQKLTTEELMLLEKEYQQALHEAVNTAIRAADSHPSWSPERKADVKEAWQKRVVVVKSLETWTPDAAHLSIDCFHWNRKGHEKVATQVLESLKGATS